MRSHGSLVMVNFQAFRYVSLGKPSWYCRTVWCPKTISPNKLCCTALPAHLGMWMKMQPSSDIRFFKSLDTPVDLPDSLTTILRLHRGNLFIPWRMVQSTSCSAKEPLVCRLTGPKPALNLTPCLRRREHRIFSQDLPPSNEFAVLHPMMF